MSSNCSGGEGLVGDSFEQFGDLDCNFCLSSGNKMDCMADIGRESFVGQPPDDL